MADPQQQQVDQRETLEVDEFTKLLEKEFKPKTDDQREDIEAAVKSLAAQALEQAKTLVISDDILQTISSLIAGLDDALTNQLNEVMHHENFQKVESAWRGLHYLVNNTATDEFLKIKVMNISKGDLAKSLKKFKGTAWDQSPFFKQVYESEYGMFGGQPYACLIGDYYFDHSPPDVALLNEIMQTCAAAHTPFIAGADPAVMRMESWQELSNPRDLTKIFQAPDYASWNSLREAEDSRYLGLAMPRFLSRLPYGAKTEPVEEFAFEEDVDGSDHSKYTWCNSAYAMATNITRAFKQFGWCSSIRGVKSGGAVEGLPVHAFPTDDGGVDMKCPTEIAIADRREAELAKNGFMPLLHKKNTDFAAFIGAQSLQKAAEYDDPDATANANLSARLPYMFAVCRFAHYLKCMVRDEIGGTKEREDVQVWLQNWINRYVEPNPSTATFADKAMRPLSAAEVIVEDDDSNPGYYAAKFYLRPHYQLEGLTVSLRLTSKLPSQKG